MKTLILILISIFYSFLSIAQYDNNWPKNSSGEIEYSEVIEVPNIESELLFGKAKMYLAEIFTSFEDVAQNIDNSNHQLIVKGNFVVKTKTMGQVWDHRFQFTFSIYCKDGKYKYSFKPTSHCYNVSQPTYSSKEYCYGDLLNTEPLCSKMILPKKMWNDEIKPSAESYIKLLISDFNKAMLNSSEDNW